MDHILVFSSTDDAQLYSTGGTDINGVRIYNYINLETSNPRWDAFKKAYMASHNNTQVPSLAPNYYDAVYMVKEAIEKTGITGDPKKLVFGSQAEDLTDTQNRDGICSGSRSLSGPFLPSFRPSPGVPSTRRRIRRSGSPSRSPSPSRRRPSIPLC